MPRNVQVSTTELAVELRASTKMPMREVVAWMRSYQELHPDRICKWDPETRTVYTKQRVM